MCTLIVSFYPNSFTPILIGSNRDENPTRPSEVWKHRDNNVYCPLDVRRGTWIGCNRHGLFSALTNWDTEYKFPVRASRGEVVLSTLNTSNIGEAKMYWDTLKSEHFRPFQLVTGTKDELWFLRCNGRELHLERLNTGVHVFTGDGFNNGERYESIKDMLISSFRDFAQPVHQTDLIDILKFHHPGEDGKYRESSVCVHDKNHKWETVSSAMVGLYREKFVVESSEGPACESGLLHHWKREEIMLNQ